MRSKEKKPPQTTRFEIWPDGGVGYKVVCSTRLEKCPKKVEKKKLRCRVQGCVEYKVTYIKNKLNRKKL